MVSVAKPRMMIGQIWAHDGRGYRVVQALCPGVNADFRSFIMEAVRPPHDQLILVVREQEDEIDPGSWKLIEEAVGDKPGRGPLPTDVAHAARGDMPWMILLCDQSSWRVHWPETGNGYTRLYRFVHTKEPEVSYETQWTWLGGSPSRITCPKCIEAIRSSTGG